MVPIDIIWGMRLITAENNVDSYFTHTGFQKQAENASTVIHIQRKLSESRNVMLVVEFKKFAVRTFVV